jgi:putative Mg2+ transporter-C (MgtC) family protein
MNPVRDEIFWGVGDLAHIKVLVGRLLVAALLGAIVGFEREEENKPAGLRTHMLVAIGSALFVLAPVLAGMELANLARVVQGLTIGIGFLGGGVIIKRERQDQIMGLTTAATIWLTAAIGMTVGLGALWAAVLVVCLAWIILFGIGRLEKRAARNGVHHD